MTKKKAFKFLTNRIVDKLVEGLVEEYEMDELDAMDAVYNSRLYEHIMDIETQLYVQSADHLFEKLRLELDETLNK